MTVAADKDRRRERKFMEIDFYRQGILHTAAVQDCASAFDIAEMIYQASNCHPDLPGFCSLPEHTQAWWVDRANGAIRGSRNDANFSGKRNQQWMHELPKLSISSRFLKSLRLFLQPRRR